MFYCKTRLLWRETDRPEETANEEAVTKIEIGIVTADDLKKVG